jgi:hypothetical protein
VSQKKLRKTIFGQRCIKPEKKEEKCDTMQYNRILEKLTSFSRGVKELPRISACTSPALVLVVFGEGARGLDGGVDISTIC